MCSNQKFLVNKTNSPFLWVSKFKRLYSKIVVLGLDICRLISKRNTCKAYKVKKRNKYQHCAVCVNFQFEKFPLESVNSGRCRQ